MQEQLAENVVLYLGDCQDLLPDIGMFELLCTDPPYGMATNYWNTTGQESQGWLNRTAKKYSRKHWNLSTNKNWQKQNAFLSERKEWDSYPVDDELINTLVDMAQESIVWGGNYFNLPPKRGWLVWTKPSRNFSLADAELAWTTLDIPIRVFDGVRNDKDTEHPTQKPISLMRWCICRSDAKTVFDPFMGSGSTGVAAVSLDRGFIGIEKSRKYFDVAVRRIKQALDEPKLPLAKPKQRKVEKDPVLVDWITNMTRERRRVKL